MYVCVYVCLFGIHADSYDTERIIIPYDDLLCYESRGLWRKAQADRWSVIVEHICSASHFDRRSRYSVVIGMRVI